MENQITTERAGEATQFYNLEADLGVAVWALGQGQWAVQPARDADCDRPHPRESMEVFTNRCAAERTGRAALERRLTTGAW